jgi:hypothetical protein
VQDCGYVWPCLLDEPRDVGHVAASSSSHWLDELIRSRGQDFGLQLHSLELEAANYCRVETIIERFQTVTKRVQIVTGSRILLMIETVQNVSERVQNVTEIVVVQQSSSAYLCLILYLLTRNSSHIYLDLIN